MIALTQQFEKRSRMFAVMVSVILVIAIGMVDYLTGYALVFSAFYLLPVSLFGKQDGFPSARKKGLHIDDEGGKSEQIPQTGFDEVRNPDEI